MDVQRPQATGVLKYQKNEHGKKNQISTQWKIEEGKSGVEHGVAGEGWREEPEVRHIRNNSPNSGMTNDPGQNGTVERDFFLFVFVLFCFSFT